MITLVKDGAPAATAGLRKGDEVLMVAGASVTHVTHAALMAMIKSSGTKFEIVYYRTVGRATSSKGPTQRPGPVASAVAAPPVVNVVDAKTLAKADEATQFILNLGKMDIQDGEDMDDIPETEVQLRHKPRFGLFLTRFSALNHPARAA